MIYFKKFFLIVNLKKSNLKFKKLNLFFYLGILILSLTASGCSKNKKSETQMNLQEQIQYSDVKIISPTSIPTIDSTGFLEIKFSGILQQNSIRNSAYLKVDLGNNSYQRIWANQNYKISYKNRTIKIEFLKNSPYRNKGANYILGLNGIKDAQGRPLKVADFEFIVRDTVAPKFLKSNIENGKINSAKEVELYFDEELQSASPLLLKTNNGGTLKNLDKDKYKLDFKPKTSGGQKDQKVIIIKLKDNALKKVTGAYAIVFGDLKDKAGNKLETTANLEFSFLESVKPLIQNNNLGSLNSSSNSFELKSNEILEFTFDETINASSISSSSVILKNSANQIIDSSKYKLELSQNGKKLKIFLLDYKLKNQTQTYTLSFTENLQDLNGNSLNLSSLSNPTSFKIQLKDSTAPRFKNSNIFNGNILENTKKITLVFSEPLKKDAEKLIKLTKSNASFTGFSSEISVDKKQIILTFNQNEPVISTNYSLEIPSTITDLAGNSIANPKKLNFTILQNSKAIFVKPNLNATDTGASWASATRFQDAMDKAASENPKKIVLVAGGSYIADPDEKKNIDKFFTLKSGLQIYGGFDPENTDAVRNLKSSIIDAKLDEDRFSETLMKGENLASETVLDGFVFQNANKTKKTEIGKFCGAALLLEKNSSPLLVNLTFKNNKIKFTGNGAAICNLTGSNPIIANSFFIKNQAGFGGAIFNNSTSPVIKNSYFIENFSTNGGGAINSVSDFTKSQAKIISSIFIKNTSQIAGGAIYDSNSNTQITNVTFIENSANNGGAIMLDENSQMKVYNSVFWQNKVWWDEKEQKIDRSKKHSRPSSIHILDNQSQTDLKHSFLSATSFFKANNQTETIDTSVGAGGKNNKTQQGLISQIDEYIFVPLKTSSTANNLINTGSNSLYQNIAGKAPNSQGELDLLSAKRLQGSNIDLGAVEAQ